MAKKSGDTIYDVVIIGGGPAGLMAACSASESGKKVLVLEKNEELGKKLLISGGGRCNMTNANPDHRKFVENYGKKGNFLFTPFSIFGVDKTLDFFHKLGIETKVEDKFRVFPKSDKSADVLNALIKKAEKNKVEFRVSAEVTGFNKAKDKIISVILKKGGEIQAKSFILTTGGKSHPETGSTGDGFNWLKDIGHKVVDSNPALVPIKINENFLSDISGITLDKVGITFWQNNSKIINKVGRLLFTHFGVSGPTILNVSKLIGEYLEYGEVKVSLDFFPGTGLDQMHEMMKKVFEENKNKKIKNLSFKEVPAKLFEVILKRLNLDGEFFINEITREERFAIIEIFKKFDMRIEGLLGLDKAVVTSGGLDLNEVDFKTMRSKKFDNLFFAGDILDFDRPSGGFSLQICWTTGYVSGKNSVL
jgi:predicted Rossmann fold flavoprotein